MRLYRNTFTRHACRLAVAAASTKPPLRLRPILCRDAKLRTIYADGGTDNPRLTCDLTREEFNQHDGMDKKQAPVTRSAGSFTRVITPLILQSV